MNNWDSLGNCASGNRERKSGERERERKRDDRQRERRGETVRRATPK